LSRISFNGTSSIKFNGTSSLKLYPDTIAPSILDGRIYNSSGNYYCEWKVTNNDPAQATITSEFNDSAPDLFETVLNSGITSSLITQDLGGFAGDGTIYAFAQASGKGPSDYVSVFVAL